jgi:hypothetical protein
VKSEITATLQTTVVPDDIARTYQLIQTHVRLGLVRCAGLVGVCWHGEAHETLAILADLVRTPGVLNPDVTQAKRRD